MTSPSLSTSSLLSLLLVASPALAASSTPDSLAELFRTTPGGVTATTTSSPSSPRVTAPKAVTPRAKAPGAAVTAASASKAKPGKSAGGAVVGVSSSAKAVKVAANPRTSSPATRAVLEMKSEAARQAWLSLTPDASRLAQWVRISNDNGREPFAIIDKRNARLFVFDAQGHLRGDSPVLLGLAPGDHSVPGIGERPIGQIRPEERTTPAGRFQGEHGLNHNGEDIIWIDYDAAVSMHRVRPTNPKERRLQRLASATASDNRISYGCVNVPKMFYDKVLLKTFVSSDRPVVYVLPDSSSLSDVFAGFPPAQQSAKDSESPSSNAEWPASTAAWLSAN